MKREENEEMRIKILDSVIACKIIAAGDEVSLSQIAYRAGISERTLNRYFPDKEMLFYNASIRYLRQTYDAFANEYLAADKTSMNGLQCLLTLIKMQIAHNHHDITRLKVFVRAYTTALRTAVYKVLPAPGYDAAIRDIVIKCVERGTADGSMRKGLIPINTYFLISSNYLGILQRLIYYYSVDCTKEEHRRQLLLVFDEYKLMLCEYLSAKGCNAPAVSE